MAILDCDEQVSLQIVNRFVTISWGDMVGTVVVQKVQVIENTKGSETTIHAIKASKADDALYNLAGQRVDASYKGIVIQNGKKRIVRKQWSRITWLQLK